MILGCVLAGGQSTRFGSDKALAMLGGQSLLTRAVDTLAAWCEQVVVVGREDAPAPTLPDWPRPNMGPLGGIAAALHLAADEGYEAVLTCGVDSVGLPADLPDLLAPAPAYVADQPVIALWPLSASAAADAILESNSKHSLRALAERVGARAVQLPANPDNINTPADLAEAEKRCGL